MNNKFFILTISTSIKLLLIPNSLSITLIAELIAVSNNSSGKSEPLSVVRSIPTKEVFLKKSTVKNKNKLVIGVPGSIDSSRRNYFKIIDTFKNKQL